MKNKYKSVYGVFNNKLEKFYVSHEQKFSDEEGVIITLITALPNEKISLSYFKNKNNKGPRLYFDKNSVLL
mgnify:CR=1 FL=1